MEVPVVADFILKVTTVGVLDPLREVTEEYECRYGRAFKHSHILDFDIFALVGRRRVRCDGLKHDGVKLGGGDGAFAVVVHFNGGLEHLEDALFCQGRGEDNGKIDKRGEAVTYRRLEMPDCILGFVLDEVPFVDAYHESFLVALDEGKDVGVLSLDSTGGVNHQDAHVGCLDGTYRAYHRVILYILVDLVFLADSGGVNKIEVKTELVVSCVDAVAGRSGDVGDDVPVLADECVNQR